jgi:hypothetical protein
MKLSTKRIIIPVLSIIFVATGTYIAIQVAKGYRPTKNGTITGTGLLAANSFPSGAEIYINDKLTSATDDTLSLTPADYQVTIKKEGFIPWQKNLTVKKELVTQTNATLFRAVPGLTPLTLSGASNLNTSPDGQKIAFAVTDASNPGKNGLYVLELNTSVPFSSPKEPRLIARNYDGKSFDQASLLWSPSSNQLLAHFESNSKDVSNYLLSSDNLNELSTLPDATVRLPVILMQWEEDLVNKETKDLALLPPALEEIATKSAQNVYFSPNQKHLLYTSTGYTTLPMNLIKTPPATSTQPEVRKLEPGKIYSYDLVEDKNYLIGSITLDPKQPVQHLLSIKAYQQPLDGVDKVASNPGKLVLLPFNHLQDPKSFYQTAMNFKTHYSPVYVGTYQWYPDSTHLIITNSNTINIVEADAQNLITVYAGPFAGSFVYPWPDGSKLIILTNLNPASELPQNLYAVDIR